MTEYCELLVYGAAKIARTGEALVFHPEIARDHRILTCLNWFATFASSFSPSCHLTVFCSNWHTSHSTISWHSWDSSVIDVDYIE
jgi:hypothetical protein